MRIHPTALVAKEASLADDVEIGPYCIIGPEVSISSGTVLKAHVVVANHTIIGKDNLIHPFASLGGVPQDLKFKGEKTRLVIGDRNVIREYVTCNIGTEGGHQETRIGNDCLFMANCHVAHDCRIGNKVILANSAALGGHVDLDDQAILGGFVGVHQFCRLGKSSFIAAGAIVVQDVLPFCIAQGDRAKIAGLNVVGLRRSGWSKEKLHVVHHVLKRLLFSKEVRSQVFQEISSELSNKYAAYPEIAEICNFMRSSQRGICQARINDSEHG